HRPYLRNFRPQRHLHRRQSLRRRMTITNHNATSADRDTTTRDCTASHCSRNAINQYRCRTRSNSTRMRRVLRFGVWRERVANAGDGFAINQHVWRARNHRRGRESLVVCSQVTQQHNFLAHYFALSFLEESSISVAVTGKQSPMVNKCSPIPNSKLMLTNTPRT